MMISGHEVPDGIKDPYRDALKKHSVKDHWDESSVTCFERAACHAALVQTMKDLYDDQKWTYAPDAEYRINGSLSLLDKYIEYAITTIRALHVALNSLLQEKRTSQYLHKQEEARADAREKSSSFYADQLWVHGANAVVHRGKRFIEVPLYRPQHDEVRQVARMYLDAPWMHCVELDWLLADVLMFVGIDAVFRTFAANLESNVLSRPHRPLSAYDDSEVDGIWVRALVNRLRWKRSALAMAGLASSVAAAYSLFAFNKAAAIVTGLVVGGAALKWVKGYPAGFTRVANNFDDAVARAYSLYQQLGIPGGGISPGALRDQCVSLTALGAQWPSELLLLLETISRRGEPRQILVPSGQDFRGGMHYSYWYPLLVSGSPKEANQPASK